MKEFNLEEYLKNPSQKVVTRDGRAVRIICTDAKGNQPIIALVYNNNRDEENAYTYYRNGCYYQDNVYYLDLFFAPLKREGWINIYASGTDIYAGQTIHKSKEVAMINKCEICVDTIKIEWEE